MLIERRTSGFAGLQVSALSLGTMTFATSGPYAKIAANEQDMARLVDVALDAGIDTFDTANVYGAGESETILGRLLGTRRPNVVVSTKIRFAMNHGVSIRPSYGSYGLSRHAIIRSVEASLQRLGTDYIDLLHLHMQDRTVPIEETLRAVDDLITSGKVRFLGISNFMAYRLVEALWTADKHGFSPVVSLQVPWSLINREVEQELIPAAQHFKLGLMVYSPLSRGFLSGKYNRRAPPPGSRLAEWQEDWKEYNVPRNWSTIDILTTMAEQYGAPISAVAIAWLLAKRPVSSVILGARNEQQLRENLAAINVKLSKQDMAVLDQQTAPSWGYPCNFIQRFEQW